jgi:hypothetical protein
MRPIETRGRDAASRATRYGLAVLLLTSVHHAYGAYAYDTPWRYHAVAVSGVTALLILGARALARRQTSGLFHRVAQTVFVLAILGVPVLAFGAFEGFYNHVMKNLLYFGGATPALTTRLFPPPTYELPNDAFFEITGILQVVPAALAAWHLYRTTCNHGAANSVGTQTMHSRSANS